MGDTNSEDAKLSYLRNLMVNYLSSDPGKSSKNKLIVISMLNVIWR